MRVLIIGSGGREHSLAWALARSPRVEQLVVLPGNGGTFNVRMPSTDAQTDSYNLVALRDFAAVHAFDLTIVGPEVPLADGVVDLFQAAGLRIWGPTQHAAQIESSKAFAKAFMRRHGIPTAAYAVFTDFEQARTYVRVRSSPVVIKANGLAAGKGVLLPNSPQEAEVALRQLMVKHTFGAAGDVVVVEDRLVGPEVSVLAFCDGHTLIPMPPCQDHKRAFDQDQGPNTGGMGAYAPTPLCPPELLDRIVTTILQPMVDGMRAEGYPYVGVLYAGLILTPDGPQVLEFNCRFGDPEAQVLLPLLETDLLKIIEASLEGRLGMLRVAWNQGAAATIVLAARGYPEMYSTGQPISGLEIAARLPDVLIFHAGTKVADDGRVLASGERVLNVTARGADLPQALERAYAAAAHIHFDGMHYRRDIGAQVVLR